MNCSRCPGRWVNGARADALGASVKDVCLLSPMLGRTHFKSGCDWPPVWFANDSVAFMTIIECYARVDLASQADRRQSFLFIFQECALCRTG